MIQAPAEHSTFLFKAKLFIRGKRNKQFTAINYGRNKDTYIGQSMMDSLPPYFATTVSYDCKL
jgi:hypothetical protein